VSQPPSQNGSNELTALRQSWHKQMDQMADLCPCSLPGLWPVQTCTKYSHKSGFARATPRRGYRRTAHPTITCLGFTSGFATDIKRSSHLADATWKPNMSWMSILHQFFVKKVVTLTGWIQDTTEVAESATAQSFPRMRGDESRQHHAGLQSA
jgi:hypothetical protein